MYNFAIIDDDNSILLLLEQLLEVFFKNSNIKKYDCAEDFFSNGDPKDFDLIITDFSLPGLSGVEMSKLIKKISSVPILILTGNTDSEFVRKIFVEGIIDEYIAKPIENNIFLERVNNLLSKNNRYIWIKDLNLNSKIKIDLSEINFVKTSDKQKIIEIHTLEDIFEIRGNLADFQKQLGSDFFKFTRNLILNPKKIEKLDYSDYSISFKNSKLNLNRNKFFEIEQYI